MNLSAFADDETASTREECARQRMEHLSILGAKTSIELCVGPSLKVLDRFGSEVGIQVTGNDIDPRWKRRYTEGRWILGDALSVNYDPFDAVVFAPPLSRGCSGKREDALQIEDVLPTYDSFLAGASATRKILVLVLPGRSLSTARDREQLFKLLALISSLGLRPEMVPLTSGPKRLTKYVDLYLLPA